MASASKRLLIIGIESFTGEYVREAFEAAGYEVYGTIMGGASGQRVYSCDVTDPLQIDAVIAHTLPDVVLHLAAITFVPEGNSAHIYDVNVFAPIHLLESLIRHGAGRTKVILPSTSNVYGNLPLESIGEGECPQPISHYALSKYAMEQMASTYFDRLPIIITRPFNYTGIGQAEKFVIPKILSHFRERKRVIELGNLDVYRDFSDVRDVAAAYVTLAESSVRGEVFNIASGNIYSLREVMAMAESASGHSLEVRINPAFVRSGEIEKLGGDNTRLRALDWYPRYRFEDTVAWMLGDV